MELTIFIALICLCCLSIGMFLLTEAIKDLHLSMQINFNFLLRSNLKLALDVYALRREIRELQGGEARSD